MRSSDWSSDVCSSDLDRDGVTALDALCAEFAGSAVPMKRIDRSKLEVLVPRLKPGCEQGALEPSCSDIDVGGLHAASLKAARAKGFRIFSTARGERAKWPVRTGQLATRGGGVWAAVFVISAGPLAGAVAIPWG